MFREILMKKIELVITFLLLSAAVTVSAQTGSKDDAALKSLVTQMADAQTSFDAAALDRILTADYIEISPAGEFDPREKVLGFYKPELKPPANVLPKVELSEFSIRTYGKFSIVIAKLTYATTVDGKAMPPRSMRATFVCRQEKNAWKIASAQYTGIRPPQPPKS
jgi:ketosteroid isomerase-like protein